MSFRPFALAALVTCLSSGCAGSGSTSSSSGGADPVYSPSATSMETTAQSLERRYLVGPAAARTIGYRIDWQYPDAGTGIDYLTVQDDSVFVLDEFNVLTRLMLDGGSRAWRLPVADPVENIFGVTLVPELEQVYLTTGSAMYQLDGATGAQTGKQRLDKIANTEPVLARPFLIYGSRNGQIVWHSYSVAYQWRGYQVAQSIKVPPVFVDGLLVAIGSDGRIMVLDGASARQMWSKNLLDGIDAAPAVNNAAVYVAGLDQHLWAFDLGSGRSLWRYLTESPLREPPALVGDRVYQFIPSEGLVSFEALPLDSPGGVVVWKAPEVTGNVLTQRQSQLIAWDAERRTLMVIDASSGAVAERVRLPQVRTIQASAPIGGDLFATGDDGRVIRLVPRNVQRRGASS